MKIVYWSGTGNTEKMAKLIAEGIAEKGKKAELLTVDNVDSDIFKDEDIIVLGCPAMGAEVLEETEFEPFIESLKEKVSGKKAALFGSFGWGDGEWMRNFQETMDSYGCIIDLDPLTVQEAPEGDSEEECRDFGRKIAEL